MEQAKNTSIVSLVLSSLALFFNLTAAWHMLHIKRAEIGYSVIAWGIIVIACVDGDEARTKR